MAKISQTNFLYYLLILLELQKTLIAFFCCRILDLSSLKNVVEFLFNVDNFNNNN